MKKLFLSTALSLSIFAVFGQGAVTFQNASTVAGWGTIMDRSVRFDGVNAIYNPALVPAGAPVSSNHAGVNLSSLRLVSWRIQIGTR